MDGPLAWRLPRLRYINRWIIWYCWLGLCAILSGCSSVEPWVKPYERERLADPLLQAQPYPLDFGYMTHVYRSREGGRGAEGSGGGGCGCN